MSLIMGVLVIALWGTERARGEKDCPEKYAALTGNGVQHECFYSPKGKLFKTMTEAQAACKK